LGLLVKNVFYLDWHNATIISRSYEPKCKRKGDVGSLSGALALNKTVCFKNGMILVVIGGYTAGEDPIGS
jgi:hypothetical protein